MFICPKCKAKVIEYQSKCVVCEEEILDSNGIYLFTKEENIKLDNEDKYFGFDTIAPHYDSSRMRSEDSKEGFLIGNYLGKDKILLEIGAGTGYHSISIAKTGCKVIAVDISINMLQILKSKIVLNKINNLIPCKMNAYELNIEDQSVDAVLINQVFQHVENPDKVIYEIKRVLKPGGKYLNIYYKGENLSSEQETKEFKDISLKINEMYDTEVKNSGQVLLERFGWISQKEQQLNILKHFTLVDTIESQSFSKDYSFSIKDHLNNYKNRVNTSQALIDKNTNEKIIINIEKKLIEEYGEDVLRMKLISREITLIQVFESL